MAFSNFVTFIKLIPQLWLLIERLGKFIEEKKLEEWVKELDGVVSDLEKASTVDEKRLAARRLLDLTRSK
jgi:hypothetical protein